MSRASSYANGDLDFAEFLERVDREVENIAGVSAFDLADYDYASAYESDLDPLDVAYDALENDGFPLGEIVPFD